MNLDSFRASLDQPAPPAGLSTPLTALWHAARDEWHAAHRIAQDDGSTEGAWVHAHLHRVEGDESNAGYWYRRAGKPAATGALEEEWAGIASALLAQEP